MDEEEVLYKIIRDLIFFGEKSLNSREQWEKDPLLFDRWYSDYRYYYGNMNQAMFVLSYMGFFSLSTYWGIKKSGEGDSPQGE